jgi:hypothetical protein
MANDFQVGRVNAWFLKQGIRTACALYPIVRGHGGGCCLPFLVAVLAVPCCRFETASACTSTSLSSLCELS